MLGNLIEKVLVEYLPSELPAEQRRDLASAGTGLARDCDEFQDGPSRIRSAQTPNFPILPFGRHGPGVHLPFSGGDDLRLFTGLLFHSRRPKKRLRKATRTTRSILFYPAIPTMGSEFPWGALDKFPKKWHAKRTDLRGAFLHAYVQCDSQGATAVPIDHFSHVLVVEDDPDDQKLLCDILEEEGFHVIGCSSAAGALEHIQHRNFGVAVVDYRLPDLSGTQLLERLRSLDDHIRVIIYTGLASYTSVKEALNLGAFAYLEKLSDPSELVRHVHRACRERVDRYASDLEQSVALRIEELARSNRDLEEFASVVAHDLRSPLLTISGYCQLICEEYGEQLDATAHDYLAQIVAGAGRMDHLIEGILEYSRAGRPVAPLCQVNMQSVVDQATANLEGSIQECGAKIVSGPLPTVTGDSTQLVQLFQNLLANAIKFRRDETPRISVSASPCDGGWQFAVEDNGIGIAEESFGQIFHTFHRLHAREYPGVGIGLAVCRKIVERHRGRIWPTSTVGQGTTFYFTIADQPPDPKTA